ncbi:hypothetical protein [Nonomuraea sp. SYSU D8015]|uniref:hypothetical protein n=1 Tax=Nonomuraea sp. SYSU D8015 TaxID=2593644 RepID=UPI0016607551|nr:hypothetical protein [Nonomuraea sp. SYSU D8015]
MSTEFLTMARDVAREMGGWDVRGGPWPNQFYIYDGDQKLCLTFDDLDDTGRVNISTSYPERSGEVYGVRQYNIGVSFKRGAAVIAREIKRRLLPNYLAELERVKKEIAEFVEAERRQVANAKAIAGALGVECAAVVHPSGIYVRTGYSGDYQDVGRPEFRVLGSGNVEIKIHARADVALKLAEFMATIK